MMPNVFNLISGLFFALVVLNPYILRSMTLSMMHKAANATKHGWMSTTQLNRQLRGEIKSTDQSKFDSR